MTARQPSVPTASSATKTSTSGPASASGCLDLEPLRRLGADALICSDVPGLESVVLQEIRFFWGGPCHETETRRADDLFPGLHRRGRAFPTRAALTHAIVTVKRRDPDSRFRVAIRPPFSVSYSEPGHDEPVERWLRKRGLRHPPVLEQ